jgi:hypothetical protein
MGLGLPGRQRALIVWVNADDFQFAEIAERDAVEIHEFASKY